MENTIKLYNFLLQWPLYLSTLALIELKPVEAQETILSNLENLANDCDSQRCQMYQEMAMNLRINEKLRQKCGDIMRIDTLLKGMSDSCAGGELNLENMGLKRYFRIFSIIQVFD